MEDCTCRATEYLKEATVLRVVTRESTIALATLVDATVLVPLEICTSVASTFLALLAVCEAATKFTLRTIAYTNNVAIRVSAALRTNNAVLVLTRAIFLFALTREVCST